MNAGNKQKEALENSAPKSPIAASRQLIQEYIRTKFMDPTERLRFLGVLRGKKVEDLSDFYTGAQTYLSLKGNIAKSDYADISEKDLKEVGMVEIKNAILRESVGFRNQIRTIKEKIFNEFTESSFSSEQKDLLQKTLEGQGGYDLKGFISSRDARRNLINRSLGNTENIRTIDFDEVCQDIAIENPTPEQKKILEKWMKGYNIAEKEISVLLNSLNGFPIEKKKSLITYFVPTVSLGFLLDHNILSRENAIKSIISEIQEIYPELSDDEIEAIGNGNIDQWLFGEDSIKIATKKLDDTAISEWWNHKDARRKFAEIIESDLIVTKANSAPGWNLEYDSENHLHPAFLKEMEKQFGSTQPEKSQVKGIGKMIDGSVIKIHDENSHKTEYIKISETDKENEDGHEGMVFTTIAVDGKFIQGIPEWRNYQEVPNLFYGGMKLGNTISILSPDEYQSDIVENRIMPNLKDIAEEEEELDLNTLLYYLDEKDPDGKEHKLEAGKSLQFEDTETGGIGILRIKNVNPVTKKITLSEGENVYEGISFKKFLSVFIGHKFKRLPEILSDEDFASFAGIEGLIAKDGLKMEGKGGDDHGHGGGHDDHGKPHGKGKPELVDIKAIITANGKGHVLVKKSSKDMVILQEYEGLKSWDDLKDEQPGIKKFEVKKTMYSKPFKLSYIEFAAYAKNAKLAKAVSHDPLVDQDSYTTDAPFHMHHNRLKSFLNIGTFGDIKKAFEMSWHALEHTMEKGQKINASKFMYRMFGQMEGDFGSQVVADYVESVGETIEKIRKKINGFNNGLKKRNKCLHLLQDTSSKPEEIAAALMVTVEGSGGLYMDVPFVGYAGSWMWFNALVRAAGYGNPAAIKAELAEKVKEVNEENPTEEMYIEQFLKRYGEVKNNPLLMAMGGYPKFRKTLIEGRKAETEKGERDAGELLGVDDRVQLGVNKMFTGEYPQVVGIYKSAMGKYAGGNADVIPWMWALSGATRMVHPNVANEFKNFTDVHGFTFHAIPFCRSPGKSDIYKKVVRKVIKEKLGDAELKAFDKIQALVEHQFSGHHHRTEKQLEEYNKEIMKGLQGFWNEHKDVLHPVLQGTGDSYIFENQDDPDFKSYADYLNETHNYRGSAGKEGFNKDYGFVDGYKTNPSFGFTDIKVENKNYRVRDIKRELEWIRIHGQSAGSIENELDTHVFQKSILPFLKNDIKNIKDGDQKKATYIANYQAILSWIREHLGGYADKKSAYNGALAQRYMQDLTELGYDLSYETVIANNDATRNKDVRTSIDTKAAEDSYGRYSRGITWNTAGEVADTKSRLDTLTKAAGGSDPGFLGTKTN